MTQRTIWPAPCPHPDKRRAVSHMKSGETWIICGACGARLR